MGIKSFSEKMSSANKLHFLMLIFLHSKGNQIFTSHVNSTQIFKTSESGLGDAFVGIYEKKATASLTHFQYKIPFVFA